MATTNGGPETRGKRRLYWCFLIRCRLEEGAGPEGEPAWRFTVLQGGGDPARRSFTCLRDVAAHIEAELATYGPSPKEKRNRRTP